MKFYSVILILAITMFVGCSSVPDQSDSSNKTDLLISAAASLTDVLTDIISLYEEENPNVSINLNLGGSGKLMQQIQQGAPADLFISADNGFMDRLERDGLVVPNTRVTIASNQLVLIASKQNDLLIQDLDQLQQTDLDQIAIGNPDSVPAGKYAQEALQKTGNWEPLQKQLIYAKDARQVLSYVASNNVELGFVYRTDLLIEDGVREVLPIAPTIHQSIVYPGAVLSTEKNIESAKDFLHFLTTNEAQSLFREHGFVTDDIN